MEVSVQCLIKDATAVIAFNRPQAMNSFNREMAEEIAQITERVRADDNIRAVLLRGAGDLFMAGGDIHSFNSRLQSATMDVATDIQLLSRAIINLVEMPKPVLASVHGAVAGVGLSFMMAADLVIAADTTKFTTAYCGLGLSPDGGASYLLPRIVGAKRAMELLLLGDVFSAETAQEYGLINRVVAAGQLEFETDKLLNRLAAGPTQAYAKTKQLISHSWHNTLEEQLALEGKAFASCCTTEDFNVGVNAFLNKQKAKFSGK